MVSNEKRNHFLLSKLAGLLLLFAVSFLGSTSALAGSLLVSWSPISNSALAGYKIKYGVASGSYSQSVNVGNVTSQTLQNLVDGTTYYLVVVGYDANGTEGAPSAEVTGVVLNSSAISANSITTSSAVVTWSTNKGSNSQVEYGLTTAYGSTTNLESSLVTAHSQMLAGLTPGKLYNYRIRSRDEGGSVHVSSNFTFTTAGASSLLLSVNAGGPEAGAFGADAGYTGGSTDVTVQPIDISHLTNPAPQQVYQSGRWGTDFSYTFSNLTPGAAYYTRLHFAENLWSSPGQRRFNVSINRTPVLTNFDILATAGKQYKAAIQQFRAVASSGGQIVVRYTQGSADLALANGIELIPASQASTPIAEINTGGGTAGTFQADPAGTTNNTNSVSDPISTSGVLNPAPQSVYQTERWGSSFTYTVSNLTANASYLVRLHFAEIMWSSTGQRKFNVLINGVTVLRAFDIIATAGGPDRATVQEFLAVPNSNRAITIQFTGGSADVPKSSGIQVVPLTPVVAVNAGGIGIGSFSGDGYFSGGSASAVTGTIDTSAITPPVPPGIYQSERSGNFSYTIPNLTPGGIYTVRLHFVDTTNLNLKQRRFDVRINGTTVLNNFDIATAAGGPSKAIALQFQVVADGSGDIVVQFSGRRFEVPRVNAIEVLK